MSERNIKGRTAIVGVGETQYYKHGKAPDPEFKMCLEAILRAIEDAGLDVSDVDGFASFSDDRNDPARLSNALGLPELRFSNMMWGGGGGGGCGAVGNAAAAVAAGLADVVVVYRALAQGQFGRVGQAPPLEHIAGPMAFNFPYGVMSAAGMFAMRVTRYMHDHGIQQEALRAISLASYHHAQANPRAVMHGRQLTPEKYDESRWIVEPFHLYDSCMENDGAAAVVITSADRAKDLRHAPAYVWAAAQGMGERQYQTWHNEPGYATANFTPLAARLWGSAGVQPTDVDVVQSYENFTGCVVMALVEHGFFTAEEANEVLQVENLIAPEGKFPLNTSGGNLAECYVHGLELVVEATRQIRGTSTSQVKDVRLSFVNSGPMCDPLSNLLLGAESS